MTIGFSMTLHKCKKNPLPTFPLTIWAYNIENFKELGIEAKNMRRFYLVDLSHHRYGPKGIVVAQCNRVGLNRSHMQRNHFHEDKVKNQYSNDKEIGPIK